MPDITRTRSAIVHEAAHKLGIVGTGQVLEDDYYQRINDNFDPLILQLAVDQICTVTDENAVPAEWFDAIAGLLANISSPIAGKAFDPQLREYYEATLRRLTSSRSSFSVLSAEYF